MNVRIFTIMAVAGLLLTSFVTAGQWTSIGPYGGGVHCLVQHPGDPMVIFAGTDSGIYRSLDGGATWAFHGLAGKQIKVITFAPSQPKTVYASVFERRYPDFLYWGGYFSSASVFKSADGGKTWAPARDGLENPETSSSNPDLFWWVSSIAVDYENPDHLWASLYGLGESSRSTEGLFESNDGGATWVLSAFPDNDVNLVEIDPRNGSTIWVSVIDKGSLFSRPRGGIFMSTDNGSSWQGASAGLEQIRDTWTHFLPFISFNFPIANPSVVYGVASTKLFRSDDLGINWRTFFEADYDSLADVETSQNSPDTVWVLQKRLGLAHTHDAGTSWNLIHDYDVWCMRPKSLLRSPRQEQELLVGASFDGLYVLDTNSSTLRRSGYGLTALAATAVVIDNRRPSRVWTAAMSGLHESDDGGASWQKVFGGCAIPIPDGSLCLNYSSLHFAPSTGKLYLPGRCGTVVSSDSGASWNYLGVSGRWPVLAIDPQDNKIVYVTNNGTMHRASNGGSLRIDPDNDWAECARLPGAVNEISIDPRQPFVIRIATDSGIVVSGDRCNSWFKTVLEGHEIHTILSLSEEKILAGAEDGLFISTDGDETWQVLAFENEIVTLLEADAETPDRLWAATTEGIWVSHDAGLSWRSLNVGLPNLWITDLEYDKFNNKLYAATAGNGVYVLEIDDGEPRRPSGRHR